MKSSLRASFVLRGAAVTAGHGGGADARDQVGHAGDVVGLQVRVEHGHDVRALQARHLDVAVDEAQLAEEHT